MRSIGLRGREIHSEGQFFGRLTYWADRGLQFHLARPPWQRRHYSYHITSSQRRTSGGLHALPGILMALPEGEIDTFYQLREAICPWHTWSADNRGPDHAVEVGVEIGFHIIHVPKREGEKEEKEEMLLDMWPADWGQHPWEFAEQAGSAIRFYTEAVAQTWDVEA
jgi:hypothetical protein